MRQKQKGYFSLRLQVVGGNLTAENIRTVSEVADQYGKGYVHMTSRQGIEIPFIRFEDIDEVKEKLTAYKQRLLSDNAFAANTDKIDAAEIYSEGDYVFFVLLGDIDDSTSSEGFAEAFGKEIQRGIDAIKEALGAM